MVFVCRQARQQGVLEGRQRQEAELAQLDQELAQRDAMISDLHDQLRQMQMELAASLAALPAAAASHSAEAAGAMTRLAAAGRCVQQLVQIVRLLLDTLLQLGAAVAAGVDRGSTSQAEAQVRVGEVTLLAACCKRT